MIVEVTILVHFRVFVLAFVAGCVWVQLNYAQNSIIKANFFFFLVFFWVSHPKLNLHLWNKHI